MRYDFDTIVNRRNTNSLKWDVADDELPMWVADMDFKTAPEIQTAIMERAKQGVFGYSIIPDAVHTDLYDNLDVIPFGKIEEFFIKYLR